MHEDTLIPLALFCGLFGVIALQILAKAVTRVICHWRDVSLKMQMIEAGFGPSEIEQVMNSGRWEKSAPGSARIPPVRKPTFAG